jgi:hypothetical protein
MKHSRKMIASTLAMALVAGCTVEAKKVAIAPALSPARAPMADVVKRPIFAAETPSTQPVQKDLPAGHPDLNELMKARQKSGQLPSGHPDISTMKGNPKANSGELPAGHPDLATLKKQQAAGEGMPGLPSNHPSMDDIQAGKVPTTQAAALGVLNVKVVQGTKGGPAIGSVPVMLELVLPDKTKLPPFGAQTDASGKLVIEELPTSTGFAPVVQTVYKGVTFQAEGQPFTAKSLTQDIELTVFESTTEEPAWAIPMQHVLVEPAGPGKLRVSQMLAIENPTDKAWAGKAIDGKSVSLNIPLPKNATDVRLVAGFQDDKATTDSGAIRNSAALLPGTAQYRFSYVLPVTNGNVDVEIVAPGNVGNLVVLIPSDDSNAIPQNLQPMGVMDMGGGPKKIFRGTGLKAGDSAKLLLSNVPSVAAVTMPPAGIPAAAAPSEPEPHLVTAEQPATASADVMYAAKAIAGTGALLVVLFGVAFLFTKGPKSKRRASA